MRSSFEDVKFGFLSSCCIDYESIAGLIDEVREVLELADEESVESVARKILNDLLIDRLVEAGIPDGMGPGQSEAKVLSPEESAVALERFGSQTRALWGFTPWHGEPRDIFDRIVREWELLGRQPDSEEICWLRATENGRRAADAWRACRRRSHDE